MILSYYNCLLIPFRNAFRCLLMSMSTPVFYRKAELLDHKFRSWFLLLRRCRSSWDCRRPSRTSRSELRGEDASADRSRLGGRSGISGRQVSLTAPLLAHAASISQPSPPRLSSSLREISRSARSWDRSDLALQLLAFPGPLTAAREWRRPVLCDVWLQRRMT